MTAPRHLGTSYRDDWRRGFLAGRPWPDLPRPTQGPGAWTAQNTEETIVRTQLGQVEETAHIIDGLPRDLPLPWGVRMSPPRGDLPAYAAVVVNTIDEVCEWAKALDSTVEYVTVGTGPEYVTSARFGRDGGVHVRVSCTAPAVAA